MNKILRSLILPAQITEFEQGRHQARVIYWKVEEGRENAKSYNWSFVVV